MAAALALLGEAGFRGVTMTAIAERTGAPIGSVYHRFASREILLAELWVELIDSFQTDFLAELRKGDGKRAAMHTLRWIRKHPNKARVFLLYRREQLMTGDWPENIKDRAEKLSAMLDKGITDFTRRFLGRADRKNIDRVVFCLIHVPSSAARSFLEAGKPVPKYYDRFVEEAYQCLLAPYRKDVAP